MDGNEDGKCFFSSHLVEQINVLHQLSPCFMAAKGPAHGYQSEHSKND